MKEQLLNLPVIVVAVTKNHTKAEICQLYDLGYRIFAESRIQELLTKIDVSKPIIWHMIGHLQTNKVKTAVTYCSMIQSIDSLHLLKAVDNEANKQNKIMEVLIQVNIANEDTKFGVNENDVLDLIKQASSLSNIMIKGLMVIGPHTDDKEKIKEVFIKAKSLYDHLKLLDQINVDFKYLSMGMSNDYQIALACGSNMLRIGSLLFSDDIDQSKNNHPK
ncbi:MAG: YggS family pyridoxal phosphate-dependent enzyme [Erysipelotrichaceae bacterium]|nr:YggS family pyridoxal phosphate-dependent enzyme [Erysipelotrichaceae bacterium]